MSVNQRKYAVVLASLFIVVVGVLIVRNQFGDSDVISRGTAEEGGDSGSLFSAPGAIDVPVVTVPLGTEGVGIRPVPFEEADPSSPNAGNITEKHQIDDSGRLTIVSAQFEDANGPKNLVWNISVNEKEIECRNCAYVVTRLRALIADVLELPIAESIESIVGWEPSRSSFGDFAGFGEQVEFVFDKTPKGKLAAQSLVNWLLTCGETCRANDKLFSDVLWNNRLWSSAGCGQDMATVVPETVYLGYVAGSSTEGDRNAAIDRVVVAAPAHRPFFENKSGIEVMTAWQVTGCGNTSQEGQ